MRILKEYFALSAPFVLSDENSVELALTPENSQKAAEYAEEYTKDTDICYKTLISLKVAASDIFDILAKNATEGESARFACTYHKYYYMMVFEFSESALPLHTLNKSIRILNTGRKNDTEERGEITEVGFMDLVHLVNRIELSVDKMSGKMRITVIKEKMYSVPVVQGELHGLKAPFEICEDSKNTQVVEDFSRRLCVQYDKNIDKFLISPALLSDNLAAGELEAVFLCDENGNCAGGAVWQRTYGITVLMVFAIFAEPESAEFYQAKEILVEDLKKKIVASKVSFIVSQVRHSELIADYFDKHDEKYAYKAVSIEKKHTSYIKPDLVPLIKKAYEDFEISREIRQINYNYTFIEPYSVLTAKVDAGSSEAVLSVMWFGDDLKANIIRHVIALKRIGIENIYFKLDLGVHEEMAVSDLVRDCGFEAKYLLPFGSDYGDIVVLLYSDNMVYEMKPCVISPVSKANIDKTPALVRNVYGENYPFAYLYNPEQFWEKVRKRDIYPYIAIDDEKKAVGLISFIRYGVNPYLFEIGQLMVDPVHRGTNIVNQLIEYVYTTAIQNLDFDAVLSESVTNHKLSQRSCVNSGFCDTALKLNIMSADAFSLEEERRRIGRMSCVVSCIERADECFTVYLPYEYAEVIKFCFEGLKPRNYESANESTETLETVGITEYRIDDSEAETSRMLNVTFFNIGADIETAVEKIESYALSMDIKSLLVNIPLSNAYNGVAVSALKSCGFYFGGVMPYWYPESDALLMQKLYANAPDWDSIKLFSRKIKKIAEFIKKDMAQP